MPNPLSPWGQFRKEWSKVHSIIIYKFDGTKVWVYFPEFLVQVLTFLLNFSIHKKLTLDNTNLFLITGVIMSLDDFYLVSSGLAAMETSLFVYDKQLLKEAKTTDIVYEPIRDQLNKQFYNCIHILYAISDNIYCK
jgi:hypothetical protein